MNLLCEGLCQSAMNFEYSLVDNQPCSLQGLFVEKPVNFKKSNGRDYGGPMETD